MKRVIVDKNISIHSVRVLESLGFEIIQTVDISEIDNCTSTHPDMQFLKISDKKALVAESAYSYYLNVLPDFDIVSLPGITGKYPDDCLLNSVLFKSLFISTSKQFAATSGYIDKTPIIVNQGYTKCSTCVLSESSVITADEGIYKKCADFGLIAYKLPDNEIVLRGYNNGFWGGCTGLLSDNQMFFNGNIELLSCFNELKSILLKEKIEPIYHKHTPLTDNGSIISIDF